jgi:hypothetical protein
MEILARRSPTDVSESIIASHAFAGYGIRRCARRHWYGRQATIA